MIYSLNQWRRTQPAHPEYAIRKDVGLLALTLFIAGIGEAIRARLSENASYLLIGSLLLLPFVFVALFLCWRLYKAYQTQSRSVKP